jgi:hypothetical protein
VIHYYPKASQGRSCQCGNGFTNLRLHRQSQQPLYTGTILKNDMAEWTCHGEFNGTALKLSNKLAKNPTNPSRNSFTIDIDAETTKRPCRLVLARRA